MNVCSSCKSRIERSVDAEIDELTIVAMGPCDHCGSRSDVSVVGDHHAKHLTDCHLVNGDIHTATEMGVEWWTDWMKGLQQQETRERLRGAESLYAAGMQLFAMPHVPKGVAFLSEEDFATLKQSIEEKPPTTEQPST